MSETGVRCGCDGYQIDGKSLLGLMSVKLGLPMRVVISGSDEELAEQYLGKYEFE